MNKVHTIYFILIIVFLSACTGDSNSALENLGENQIISDSSDVKSPDTQTLEMIDRVQLAFTKVERPNFQQVLSEGDGSG